MAGGLKKTLFTLHKYVSLVLVAIWSIQILSGVILVFAPEINDQRFGGGKVPLDLSAVSQTIEEHHANNPDWEPQLVFTTHAKSSRFDIYAYHEDSDTLGSRAIRIDGDGTILADRRMKYDFLNRVSELHETLWISGWGYILLGVSGILLLTNMIIGLYLIWPQRKRWGAFFKLDAGRPLVFRRLQLHRMLGLVFVLPGIYVVGTGVANMWLGDMKETFGDPWAAPAAVTERAPAETIEVSLVEAMEIAWAEYPDATLSIVTLPSTDTPYYTIRLRQPGEVREVYGNTKLWVDAVDGSVLGNVDQVNAGAKATLFSSFFALHMGQPFGIFGKIVFFLTGAALLVLSVYGVLLWQARSSLRKQGKVTS
ncbi:PepSY-associated TM helix domain-containing protein [Henriciella pelagia]|jgi:uncharacterized iron-regulated membrane protein|uniref:PepSY domain-containing protein n=1 Tax=Henriciella pelagia TaxID=1977912 RepID=A0ABQ1JW60_9PROT|nr:PepSY-associated TM helix domain-containing protein [Henriciella pelagia]GGB80037.1 hypothetical protein GCM10011503_30960 [Henriciella pelagia]